MRAYIAFITAALLLAASADAVKVGVVVEYPDGETYERCITADEEDDGYEILQKTGLSIDWSTSPAWGHGLCAIDGVGCESENCWCTDEYWGFYVMHQGDGSWTYSPVGFDGGESCGEHYCAKDGDMVGFAYGTYGTKPQKTTYDEVCGEKLTRKKYAKGFTVTAEPQNIRAGNDIQLTVLDGYGDPVEYAKLEAYLGQPGASAVAYAGEIRNGKITFTLQEEGIYTLRVTATEYRPNQEYVNLVAGPKQTTSSTMTTTTSTTSSTTTTTTSTTSTPPKANPSPTTSRTSTSTLEAAAISPSSKTSAIPAATGKVTSVHGYMAASILLILAAALYLRRKKG